MGFGESKAMLILDQRNALRDCLTKDEIQDAKDTFAAIDVDSNGHITESEARKHFEKRADIDVKNQLRTQKAAMATVEKQVKTLFMFKDADGSGTVDFDEFLSEEAKNIIADRFSDNKQSLVVAKTDGGEPVDGESCESILSVEQIEHAQMKFNDWDADGNGTLELKELQKIAKQLNLKVSAKEF